MARSGRYPGELGDELAPLIGAEVGTVAVGDQTSVNLYKLATAALRHVGRASILTDAGNFPSDRYVLAGVAEAAGGSLVVAPEDLDEKAVYHVEQFLLRGGRVLLMLDPVHAALGL